MTVGAPLKNVWPGSAVPLGASWDGNGVNFALFSAGATAVELCLFDPQGQELQRIPVTARTDQVWHCYLPQTRPGLLYGWRCSGPYDPARGLRFNPNKLLLDPYTRALAGSLRWNGTQFGYLQPTPAPNPGAAPASKAGAVASPKTDAVASPKPDAPAAAPEADADLTFDERDSAPGLFRCRVTDSEFDWGADHPPGIPWHDTVIYETHVRGFTLQHPQVPQALRGTYLGLAQPAVIDHLKQLGVTAVELLPVHAFVDDYHLVKQGLRNYWGYNSVAFLAPEPRYATAGGDAVVEFKTMVKALHAAGLEVILDVVYNHTGEGSERGPTLSLRGIDNATYYRLDPQDPRRYRDYTGTGNTVNAPHPRALALIMDSLRYWVQEMHVDGFRFDLASTLARGIDGVEPQGAFLGAIAQDPVLSRVKLIAEPWDIGPGGYQVGHFPPGWKEWNDRYRDCVRAFWKGDGGLLGEFAGRFTGSADLFAASRGPLSSINFITAHDGFTLNDLVSYNAKHNSANGENNRDGTDDNRSWNCGAEGPSADANINALRRRQRRNLVTTLLLSQGVPMLLAGDEIGRSQGGNNNAYNQDNYTSWVNWEVLPSERVFLEFVARVVALRRAHPVFTRTDFLTGRTSADGQKDVGWYTPQGTAMIEADWRHDYARCLTIWLNGTGTHRVDSHGRPLSDESFVLLVNAHYGAVDFVLPACAPGRSWRLVIDTAQESAEPAAETLAGGATRTLPARARAVLIEA